LPHPWGGETGSFKYKKPFRKPMKLELLEEIGLTKSEIKVYLALLELGSSTTGPMVDKSGAASSKIYEILDRLIQKGLVSYAIKAGTKHFEAADPKRLLDYMKEKEQKLKQQEKELTKLLPELKLKQKLAKKTSKVHVYKGFKGLETVYKDLLTGLKKGDTTDVFVIGAVDDNVNNFFTENYKERSKMGIKTKAIFSESGRQSYEARKNIPLVEGKVIGTTTSPATTQIFGNKVHLRIGDTQDLISVVIENTKLAHAFKEQFDLMWNQKVHVFEGVKEVTIFFRNILKELKKGDEYWVINPTYGTEAPKELYTFFRKYHLQRGKAGIKANFLISAQETCLRSILEKKPIGFKSLPADFSSPLQIAFYGKKLYIWLAVKKPVGFLIESKEAVDAFKEYFKNLWGQETQIVKGLDAVQNIFNEMLEAGHCDFIGAEGYFIDHRPDFIKEWEKRAQKQGFTMRNVVNPETKGHKITKFPFAETKYTIKKEFSSLSVFWIYGKKVVITNWMEEEPLVFIIENENFYNLYKQQFEVLWKS
jgi:HTH-type transcriptional regulator, sugar sensing transcriptional regulator